MIVIAFLLGSINLLLFGGLLGLSKGFSINSLGLSKNQPCQGRRYYPKIRAYSEYVRKVYAGGDFGNRDDPTTEDGVLSPIFDDPRRVVCFSLLMTCSGAILGPFLDSFHSAFGVLQYDSPIGAQLWGRDADHPALITAWWVPELFGLAGFLIGWLYILLAQVFDTARTVDSPTPPKILIGISLFTFQYWLSGALYQSGVDRTTILYVMSLVAAGGFWALDASMAGFVASSMMALGGPTIELGLLTASSSLPTIGFDGYHYSDLGETGYFPLWIIPVYFLGGPANGNLAKGYWSFLKQALAKVDKSTDKV